ncbi:hypothetical protein, partial [Escherichia coli]|uniref:hypothetical protein n=1 Tax=Escherichia coli TaxID=562 RepID=UPI00307A1F72
SHPSYTKLLCKLPFLPLIFSLIMSDKCGNCDCADKSQCVKKGNSLVIETESYIETFVVDAPAAENDGKCKCGTACACVNCTCGH